MFILQGKEVGVNQLVDMQVTLVRTYKGEINRTQTGVIAAFPNFFVTVGINAVFQGKKAAMKEIEQILLATDLVKIAVLWQQWNFSGMFSCTTNTATDIKDDSESYSQLQVALVSDGTDIAKADGSTFKVELSDHTSVQSGCYMGKVYQLPTGYTYTMEGFALPDRKLLVLGDTVVARTSV